MAIVASIILVNEYTASLPLLSFASIALQAFLKCSADSRKTESRSTSLATVTFLARLRDVGAEPDDEGACELLDVCRSDVGSGCCGDVSRGDISGDANGDGCSDGDDIVCKGGDGDGRDMNSSEVGCEDDANSVCNGGDGEVNSWEELLA